MTTAPSAASGAAAEHGENDGSPSTARLGRVRDFFAIPAPLKRLFDCFPRRVYPVNVLGVRTAQLLGLRDGEEGKEDGLYRLFVWTERGSADGRVASFNPKCLMWQVYLLAQGISFRTIASNNHASPSGTLPFLIPGPDTEHVPSFSGRDFITQEIMKKWAREEDSSMLEATAKLQQEMYMSAIEGPIRRAWLYHMYLTPNFHLLTTPSYIHSQTTNPIVRLAMARDLRSAAEEELLKHTPKISEENVYEDAREAFKAFDRLLRRQDSGLTLGTERPTLLDAALFAYSFLLLGLDTEAWADARLPILVKECEAVVGHRDLVASWFDGGGLSLPDQYIRVSKRYDATP